MAAKVPSNLFLSKYTTEGKFVVKNTYAPYKGYYYTINNKVYAGQQYDINSPELITVEEANLSTRASSVDVYTYTAVSKNSVTPTPPVPHIPFAPTNEDFSNGFAMRYFYKKVNEDIIRETDRESYASIQGNPIYQTTEVKFPFVNNNPIIEAAEKIMKGLKNILEEYVLPAGDGGEETLKPKSRECGYIAVIPDTSSISDEEIFIKEYPDGISTNRGKITKVAFFPGVDRNLKGGKFGPEDFVVDAKIAKPLKAMINAAERDGIKLLLFSGLRSPETTISTSGGKSPVPGRENVPFNSESQKTLYDAYVARGFTGDIVAEPKKSNHGDGIAFDLNAHVDLYLDGKKVDGNKLHGNAAKNAILKARVRPAEDIKVIGDELAVYKWLVANAWQYGFVRTVAGEGHHWEYLPGRCQFADRVPRSNGLYVALGEDFINNLQPSAPWEGEIAPLPNPKLDYPAIDNAFLKKPVTLDVIKQPGIIKAPPSVLSTPPLNIAELQKSKTLKLSEILKKKK